MNKKAQALRLVGMIGSMFATMVIYFLVLNPIISPTLEIAITSIDSVGLKVLIKFIPFAVLFGFSLFLMEVFTGRR